MKIDMSSVEAFMARIRVAAKTGSKEIRVPISEATELAAAMAQVLAQNVQLAHNLRETENLVGKSIKINGGSF